MVVKGTMHVALQVRLIVSTSDYLGPSVEVVTLEK